MGIPSLHSNSKNIIFRNSRERLEIFSSSLQDLPCFWSVQILDKKTRVTETFFKFNQVIPLRFTKTLRKPRDDRRVTRGYVATIAYEFRPDTKQLLQEVWGNPLGFVVTSYRVDAETLEN